MYSSFPLAFPCTYDSHHRYASFKLGSKLLHTHLSIHLFFYSLISARQFVFVSVLSMLSLAGKQASFSAQRLHSPFSPSQSYQPSANSVKIRARVVEFFAIHCNLVPFLSVNETKDPVSCLDCLVQLWLSLRVAFDTLFPRPDMFF